MTLSNWHFSSVLILDLCYNNASRHLCSIIFQIVRICSIIFQIVSLCSIIFQIVRVGLFSFRLFRPILDLPGSVGAVWNRTGFEKEDSKIETTPQFI